MKIEIDASVPFKEEFMNLANTMYIILPYFLKKEKNTNFNEPRAKKIFLELIEPSLNALPHIEGKNHLETIYKNPKSINHLSSFMEKLKITSYAKSFREIEKKIFNAFFNIYTLSEEFPESLELVLSKVMMLDNKDLRISIKSIDNPHADPIKSYKINEKELNDLTLKLFNKVLPSHKEVEELKKKSPELYKQLDNKRSLVKLKSWELINSEWEDSIGKEFLTPEEANELYARVGLKAVDPNFEGFVSVNKTKGGDLLFYTLNKGVLDKKVGTEGVRMNTSKKDYYCLTPRIGKDGKLSDYKNENLSIKERFQHIYPLNGKAKNADNKFVATRLLGNPDRYDIPGDKLKNIRKNVFVKDLESNNTYTKHKAIICILGDITKARLGTSKKDNYGVHTWKRSHLIVTKDSATFDYIGKGKKDKETGEGVRYVHTISMNTKTVYAELKCPSGKMALRVLIDELIKLKKGPSDSFLFPGQKGSDTISENTINDYLELHGWPGTFHMFRTYFACKEFYKEIKKIEEKGNSYSQDEAIEEYERILTKVSDQLGNTHQACIGSYIDKLLIKQLFDVMSAKIPQSTLTIITKEQGKLDGISTTGDSEEEYVPKEKVRKPVEDSEEYIPKEKIRKQPKEKYVPKEKVRKPVKEIGKDDPITIIHEGNQKSGIITKVVEDENGTYYYFKLDSGKALRIRSNSKYLIKVG